MAFRRTGLASSTSPSAALVVLVEVTGRLMPGLLVRPRRQHARTQRTRVRVSNMRITLRRDGRLKGAVTAPPNPGESPDSSYVLQVEASASSIIPPLKSLLPPRRNSSNPRRLQPSRAPKIFLSSLMRSHVGGAGMAHLPRGVAMVLSARRTTWGVPATGANLD